MSFYIFKTNYIITQIMNNINSITIHIGMPKCASTTLQRNFFNHLPLINYAGSEGTRESFNLTNKVLQSDDFYYNEAEILNKYNSFCDPNKPLVISNEHTSGVNMPFSKIMTQNIKTIADRYKSLFPHAKILIIIRNQFDIQKSMYVQKMFTLHDFLSIKKMSFNKWIELNIHNVNSGWRSCFEFADYYSVIRYFYDLFENVKVVVFENMVKDMKGFIQHELSPFIGLIGEEAIQYYDSTVTNKRHNKAEILLNKIIQNSNSILINKLGNPQKYISKEKRLALMDNFNKLVGSFSGGKIKTNYTEEQKQFITDFYGNNNKKLSDMLQIDLSKYSYPMK